MRYKPKPHQSPAWSIKGGAIPVANEISRWEKFLADEHIGEKELKTNPKVFQFIRENADRFYVPSKILKFYGVEPNV